MTDNKSAFARPRIAEMVGYYVGHRYMAYLGPYVSSVFFALISNSRVSDERPAACVKGADLSMAQIADMAGISKRKSIDALAVLRDHRIIMRRVGRGRGNMNRYYFLPCEAWLHPDGSQGRDDGGAQRPI